MKLKELFTFLPKSDKPASYGKESGMYPFFTSSNVINKYVDEADYSGEFLIIGDGGTGNCKYYNGAFSASDHNYVLKPINHKNTRLIRYFLMKDDYKVLNEGFKGVGIKNISKSYIGEIEYSKNSKYSDEFVVDSLDHINGEIDKLNKELFLFDELIKSRFNEMFGTIKNEHSFIECTLGDEITTLSDFSANGSYAKLDSNVKMFDEPNFAWMVRTTDLENENFTDIKYIDEKAYNLLSKSQLFGNELIMCKIGSAGKIYLMPKINMPASLGRNAFLIRFNNQNVNMTYLFAYLNTYDLQKEIQQRVKGAVTKTITKDEVRSIPLILPPKALQDKYSAFVKQVDKLKFSRLVENHVISNKRIGGICA